MNDDTGNASLLEFPCDFPIKIMGMHSDDFSQSMVEIVLRHAPDFDTGRMEIRASSGGKYLSLTCTLRAVSKAQLDGLYGELTAHPQVKVVL